MALHLVIGAGEFLGDHVSRALAGEVPVIAISADADDETLGEAINAVEVVHICAQTWSPVHRLRYRTAAPSLLKRIVEAGHVAGVRRIVLVSTADVFGPDHFKRISEKSKLRPVHAYERLKLFEEEWLRIAAADLQVVVVRPARVFGVGEDSILPRLMSSVARGRLWLPGGGRARQTFVSAADVGRACLAAADRGRPGHSYLVAGFDASWRDLLESASRSVGLEPDIASLPYDLAYLKALANEATTSPGAVVWPGLFAIDAIGKPHSYDDSHSRRELTWSPSVGSFEQEMPQMAKWLAELMAGVQAPVTSPPSRSPS
ncbi:MAG: NAD-dependent epimerase/dehydratase family protein [Candidatus Dormibacteraeota bacterium]|nr:NAD-dependent epimerase/dehydratase family protein [Candidatus Dormibacteraeota bacterium]